LRGQRLSEERLVEVRVYRLVPQMVVVAVKQASVEMHATAAVLVGAT
jgi:hypothetical protein